MPVDINYFFGRVLACYPGPTNQRMDNRDRQWWERLMLESIDEEEEPGRTLLHILIWAGVLIRAGDVAYLELPNDEDHIVFRMLDRWEQTGFAPIEDGPAFVEQC